MDQHLTPRQHEVMLLVIEGRSNKDIAVALGISVKTIETHRAAINKTLGVRNALQLFRHAAFAGWVKGLMAVKPYNH